MKGEYEEVDIEEEFSDSEEEATPETKPYNVIKENYDHEKEAKKKVRKQKETALEKQNLAEMKLSKKKKRLLDKIKNFDEAKKEKVRELIRKKKALKKKSN